MSVVTASAGVVVAASAGGIVAASAGGVVAASAGGVDGVNTPQPCMVSVVAASLDVSAGSGKQSPRML